MLLRSHESNRQLATNLTDTNEIRNPKLRNRRIRNPKLRNSKSEILNSTCRILGSIKPSPTPPKAKKSKYRFIVVQSNIGFCGGYNRSRRREYRLSDSSIGAKYRFSDSSIDSAVARIWVLWQLNRRVKSASKVRQKCVKYLFSDSSIGGAADSPI